MEILLHRLHAATQDSQLHTFQPMSNQDVFRDDWPIVQPITVPSSNTLSRPFAIVDELTQGSPAETAGLYLHDKIIQFGPITGQTPHTLQSIAQMLSESAEGRDVETVVLRSDGYRENVIVLTLRLQKWKGRGLLGCHLRPL